MKLYAVNAYTHQFYKLSASSLGICRATAAAAAAVVSEECGGPQGGCPLYVRPVDAPLVRSGLAQSVAKRAAIAAAIVRTNAARRVSLLAAGASYSLAVELWEAQVQYGP